MLAIVPSAPTTQEAVVAFIRAKGKMKLAAEDLGIEPEELSLILVRNKAELYEAIEAITLLEAFDLYNFTGTMIKGKLAEAAPADVIKAHTNLVETIRSITSPKNSNNVNVFGDFNIDQRVLEMLHPEEREAVLTLSRADGTN